MWCTQGHNLEARLSAEEGADTMAFEGMIADALVYNDFDIVSGQSSRSSQRYTATPLHRPHVPCAILCLVPVLLRC